MNLRLLVWINGDKGYHGLQKVGDRFTQASGVEVVVGLRRLGRGTLEPRR